MSKVETYIEDLIEREGGYTNHASDRGGPTTWGITERVARAYGYTGPMRDLPKEKAREIYLAQYWSEPGFDDVSLVMPGLAEELFDTGVNQGPTTAAKYLQRALNVLNKRGSIYSDLIVDGKIGKMTIYGLKMLRNQRGVTAETVLVRVCDALQAVRYVELAEKNETQEDFMYGWILNRIGELK